MPAKEIRYVSLQVMTVNDPRRGRAVFPVEVLDVSPGVGRQMATVRPVGGTGEVSMAASRLFDTLEEAAAYMPGSLKE